MIKETINEAKVMENKILNIGCENDTRGTHFIDKFPKKRHVPQVIQCDMDIDKIPFDGKYFDEVIFENCIEHLTNIGHAMQEIYRVLKTGGQLHLVTDNALYWYFSVKDTHLSDNYFKYLLHNSDNHYCLFTEYHLKALAKKFGFITYTTQYIEKWFKPLPQYVEKKNLELKDTKFWRSRYELIGLEATK